MYMSPANSCPVAKLRAKPALPSPVLCQIKSFIVTRTRQYTTRAVPRYLTS
jgi:hypothetical protein